MIVVRVAAIGLPRKVAAVAADLSRARKAFEDFTGHKATKVDKHQLDDRPVSGYRLGKIEGIAYEAKRDGETAKYFHEFGKKARPDLVVRDDGKRMYITGGRYKVTDHGIEDMPALFVVNPSPRKKVAAKAAPKKRKAAPMAKRRKSTRRAAPRRRVVVVNANPIRRRRRRRAVAKTTRRRAYRRNPIRAVRRARRAIGSRIGGRGFPKISGLIMPAVGIGAGAVLAELGMGYLPIPANFKTGPMRHATKGVVSLALGLVVSKFVNKKAGELMALGGLTIAAHDLMKEAVLRALPSAKFGGLGYYNPGQLTQLGQYVDTSPGGFGQYVSGVGPGGFADSGGENISFAV